MTHSPASPARTTAPEKNEAGHRVNGAGLMDQQTHADSAALVERDQEKRFQTIRAQLALKGYSLARTDLRDGQQVFYIVRWSQCNEVKSLDQASAFLTQVGGAE